MFFRVFGLGLALMATGCASAEWHQENAQCQRKFAALIPPVLETRPETRQRAIQVPTGRTHCTTSGNRTNCTQLMRTEFIPYTEWVTIDLNAPQRNAEIATCTASACMIRIGNPDCTVRRQ